MPKDRDRFIEKLTAEHRPVRPLPQPVYRAISWTGASLIMTAALLWLVQPFNLDYTRELLAHPRLAIEVMAALLCVWWAAYALMVNATPGERLSRPARMAAWLCCVIFVVTLVLSFFMSPVHCLAQAPHRHCWIEVIVYGCGALGFMVWMSRKAWLRPRSGLRLLGGLGAGLVPAILMQVGCIVAPVHALKFHYAPVLFVVALGTWLIGLRSRPSK